MNTPTTHTHTHTHTHTSDPDLLDSLQGNTVSTSASTVIRLMATDLTECPHTVFYRLSAAAPLRKSVFQDCMLDSEFV